MRKFPTHEVIYRNLKMAGCSRHFPLEVSSNSSSDEEPVICSYPDSPLKGLRSSIAYAVPVLLCHLIGFGFLLRAYRTVYVIIINIGTIICSPC